MGFKTILEVDGVIRNVLNFRIEYFVPDYKLKDTNKSFWSIDDYKTLPLASWRIGAFYPIGGLLEMTFESTSNDDDFWFWLGNNKEVPAKNGKIVMFSDDEFMPLRVLEFWDCFLINISETFNSISENPMTFSVRLSPGILQINRGNIINKYWKWTNFEEKSNFAVEEEKTPRVTRMYWMDEKEEKHIDEFNGEPILFIAETADYDEGEILDFPLKNKKTGKITTISGKVDQLGKVKIIYKDI